MANMLPRFANPVTWDIQSSYDALTIVINDGHAYTSKQAVPSGTQLSNTNYWYPTGNAYKLISDLMNTFADYYNKTQVDNLLANKLDKSNYVTVNNGLFAGLVKEGEVWLLIVQRISTTDTCILVASNHQGTINVKEVLKDTPFSYLTNSQGTVNIKWGNSDIGIYGGAYKLK